MTHRNSRGFLLPQPHSRSNKCRPSHRVRVKQFFRLDLTPVTRFIVATCPADIAELRRLNFLPPVNLTIVKSFRLCLLLLLVALLPMRGALAAAMLCNGGGLGGQAQTQLMSKAHAHAYEGGGESGDQHSHHEVAAHEHGTAHDHTGGGAHDDAGGAEKCSQCSTTCCATGLVSADLAFAASQPAPTVFSHLYAPPPSFVSDGQDRPPRTI